MNVTEAKDFKIIFFKYQHSESMTLIDEKELIKMFRNLQEAQCWAEKECNNLQRSGKEEWRVYIVRELGL